MGLSQALAGARNAVQSGVADTPDLRERVREQMRSSGLRVEYVEAVDGATLLPQATVGEGTLLAVAAYAGETRLIDNLLLCDLLREP